MKSWARTVLRPFAWARFAACPSSQYMYSFRAVNASPAVLQPAFLSTPFALLAMTSDSSDFLAIFDLRIEGLSSDCRSFYLRGPDREIFRSLALIRRGARRGRCRGGCRGGRRGRTAIFPTPGVPPCAAFYPRPGEAGLARASHRPDGSRCP